MAVFGKQRFRVKLQAPHWQELMRNRHNFTISIGFFIPGVHLKVGGQGGRGNHQRMVAGGIEGRR